jgi:glycosyltransferase involved in cell wall biosynthesis
MAADGGSEGPVPLVSVIVPARNASAKVPRFLDAIERQTVPTSDYELLIVDDGSSDETAMIVREGGQATLLSLSSHGGAYVARNRGIDAAQAKILAFTDADCIPAEDWLERGIAALENGDADLIAGQIDVPLGERSSAAQLVDFSSWYDQADFASRGVAATGNLWIRREVLSRIGGFDETLMSGGDMDLTERAVGRGYKLEYAGDVVVTHLPEGSWHVLKKSYREGNEAARRGRSHLRKWLRGGDPDWRTARGGRLAAHGYSPRPSKRLSMFLVKNFLIRLPMLAGNLTGLAARLRDRRAA